MLHIDSKFGNREQKKGFGCIKPSLVEPVP